MKTKTLKAIPKKGTVASLEKNTMIFLTLLSIFSSVATTLIEHCCDDSMFYTNLIKNILLGIVGSGLVSIVVVYVPYSSKKRNAVEKFYKNAVQVYFTYNNVLNILLTTEEIFFAAKKNNSENDDSSLDILQFKKSVPEEINKLYSDIVYISNELNSLEFTSKEIENIMDSIKNSIFLGAELINKLYDSMFTLVREDFYKPELYPSIICYFTRKIYDITNTKYPYEKVHSVFKNITDSKAQNYFFIKNIDNANTQLISSLEKIQIDVNTATATTEFSSSVIEFNRDLYTDFSVKTNSNYSDESNDKKQTDSKGE